MKIAVLTDADSAAGYRLAGVQTTVAADAAGARKALAQMIQEGDYVLIGVSEALLPDPYQAVRREVHGRDLPLLLAITSPLFTVTGGEGDAEAFVRRLILSTMGHEIKL